MLLGHSDACTLSSVGGLWEARIGVGLTDCGVPGQCWLSTAEGPTREPDASGVYRLSGVWEVLQECVMLTDMGSCV
jgi:hypothetical protein